MDDASKREAREAIDRDAAAAVANLTARASSSEAPDPDLEYLLGTARFRVQDFPGAEVAFRKAMALGAINGETMYYIGLCAQRMGRTDEAVGAFRASAAMGGRSQGKAQEKLRLLGAAPAAPPAASRATSGGGTRKSGQPAKDSSLILPDSEEDFEDFERRERRRQEIVTRAQFRAGLKTLPAQLGVIFVFFSVVLSVVAVVTLLAGAWSLDELQSQYCDNARTADYLPDC